MSIDKGREGSDRPPPDDWERIELERAQRDRLQRKWDAEHDPSPEWEAAARPLPPDHGLDRPRHREIPPEVAQMFGRTPEQMQALREKMFDELEARRDSLTGAADAAAEQAGEVNRTDTDRPAEFDGERADRIAEFQEPGGKTRGLLAIGGREVEVVSGYDGPAKDFGGNRALGLPGGYVIGSHAEAHAAALLRSGEAPEQEEAAELYLNRRPCGGRAGCNAMLPVMLPADRVVNVFFMEDPDAPRRPNELGPMLDNQGRSWRGKAYQGRAEET